MVCSLISSLIVGIDPPREAVLFAAFIAVVGLSIDGGCMVGFRKMFVDVGDVGGMGTGEVGGAEATVHACCCVGSIRPGSKPGNNEERDVF